MYDFSQMEAREKERAEIAAKRKWENGKENNQINKGGDKMNGDKQKIDRKVNELEKLNMDLGVVRHYTARGLVFVIIALPASGSQCPPSRRAAFCAWTGCWAWT